MAFQIASMEYQKQLLSLFLQNANRLNKELRPLSILVADSDLTIPLKIRPALVAMIVARYP